MIIPYKGKLPQIGKNVFIAPTAAVIGDVVIGNDCSIWYGAVVRGDTDCIIIGDRTNIQDNCILHVDFGAPMTIGSDVTIGHNAVVHGCTIEDCSLVGISAVVLNRVTIHTGSIVAAGAVVSEGATVGPYELAAGVPATIKKKYSVDQIAFLRHEAQVYIDLAREHMLNKPISTVPKSGW